MVIEDIKIVVVVVSGQGMREHPEVCGIVLYRATGIVTWVYTYVKFHGAGQLGCTQFMYNTPP